MPEIRPITNNSAKPPQELACVHCGSIIGAYTELALAIGGAIYYKPHAGHCGQCHRVFKWRPGGGSNGSGKIDA